MGGLYTSFECEVVLSSSSSSSRLKREDDTHPKHDHLFSDWQILIGPSDWEGAERYRFHNLPNCFSCSGLYELGIVMPPAHPGHKTGNPEPPIPVYLGQSDNIRTRLQCYGREGAHLENGNLNSQLNDYVPQGHGLFSDVFSRGYYIVYRWAPMKNEAEAEKTETLLLNKYDYAWNKGNNGVRCHEEVLQKLNLSKKHSGFHKKKTGVKTETFKSFSWEEGSGPSGTYTNWESNEETFFTKPPEVRGKRCEVHKCRRATASKLSRAFDTPFGNSTYQSVSYESVVKEDYSSTCGATSVDGSSCRRPPAEGRKRCWQHTGMWGNRTPVPRNKRCDWHKGKRAAPY